MVKKIKNSFFVVTFIMFIFLTFQYYFSENNIKFTNKSRSSYYVKSEDDIMKLPLLKNNTNNIILGSTSWIF